MVLLLLVSYFFTYDPEGNLAWSAVGSMSFDSTKPGYGSAERILSRITNQLGVSCND